MNIEKFKNCLINQKRKAQLLERDGDLCFFCNEHLGEDITLEHLISLTKGGKDNLENSVLAHEECNLKAGNLPIFEKVKLAIELRSKNSIQKQEEKKPDFITARVRFPNEETPVIMSYFDRNQFTRDKVFKDETFGNYQGVYVAVNNKDLCTDL